MSRQAPIAKTAQKGKASPLPYIIQKNQKLFITYVAFLVIYAVFTLVPKPPEQILLRFHLSSLGVRLIYLTIIILLSIIWGTGFYGFAKLRAYAKLIAKQKDGKQVETISRGVFLLVMWLPVSEVVSSVLNYIATHHLNLLPVITIVDNYINLILPLTGFIFIGVGAHGLSGLVKSRHAYSISSLLSVAVVFIGITYAHLVASTTNRSLVYHLSLWVILLTIVTPYMYMWFAGIIAAYEIYNYQHKISGVLYRRSWNLLAYGCGWLIATSIIFQYLTTLVSHLDQLSIYWLLVIVYSLLAVISIGFIFIALGAAKLQKIEEI